MQDYQLDLGPNLNMRVTFHQCTQSIDDKRKGTVVMVHGLAASPDDYLQRQLANFLCAHDYDVLQAWLYGHDANQRKLCDIRFEDHLDDLGVLIENKRRMGEKVILLGHSWGGLIAGSIAANPLYSDDIRGLILLDPTGIPGWHETTTPISGDHRVINWAGSPLVHNDYVQFAQNLAADPQIVIGLAEIISCPMFNVIAGQDEKSGRLRRLWHEHTGDSSDLIVVDGADHQFRDPQAFNKMATSVLAFINELNP